MWEFIGDNWQKFTFGIALVTTMWFGKREVDRYDRNHSDHEARLKDLERRNVTLDDLEELRSSVSVSMGDMADVIERRMASQHAENRETLRHIQSQLTDLWKHK